MKIAIVDDEKPIRQWFSYILGKIDGVEIIGSYPNGQKALLECKEKKPDVIFTDIKMPVMDGIELIENIKSANPEIEVVILSNFDDFEYVYKGLKLGAEDYLLKSQADDEKIVEVLVHLKEKLKAKKIPERKVEKEYNSQIVERMISYIENGYSGNIKLALVAQELNYNSDYLSQIFKKETGKNFNTYLIEVRMEKAKELLLTGSGKIREVAEKVGYANEMYFSTAFKGYTGISPKKFILQYKKN